MSETPVNSGVLPDKGNGGRIMLSAIVLLFTVVVLMICLHIYARWYLLRARQNQRNRRRRRNGTARAQLVFYSDPNSAAASLGLDAAVLSSIPVIPYSPKTHPELPECAVCLSDFEENERIRVLPKCRHGFHVDCIDMWFHSHSTCPLCRSSVEPEIENREFVVSIDEPGGSGFGSPDLSYGFCARCKEEEESCSSSSLGGRRKAFELGRVTIEVPRRYESEEELRINLPPTPGLKSPATPALGSKSPVARLMSLKRILSGKRKALEVSPTSPGVGTSRGVAGSELDIESGRDQSTQGQIRAQTPR